MIDPIAYLHGGHDNIFPKVEEAIHGKNVGDSVEITLDPADAFGDYDEGLVQIEPLSAFPEKIIKEGMQFEGEDESGNHPWAGQRVLFMATIKDVRDANQEEIEHKHVHGPGGHHHH